MHWNFQLVGSYFSTSSSSFWNNPIWVMSECNHTSLFLKALLVFFISIIDSLTILLINFYIISGSFVISKNLQGIERWKSSSFSSHPHLTIKHHLNPKRIHLEMEFKIPINQDLKRLHLKIKIRFKLVHILEGVAHFLQELLLIVWCSELKVTLLVAAAVMSLTSNLLLVLHG